MRGDPAIHGVRPRVAVPCRCVLGEGPVWDGRTGTLMWVDIRAGELLSWRPAEGGAADVRSLGEPVSFVALTPDPGTVLVGLASGIGRLRLASGAPERILRPEPDRVGHRLNDGNVAPDGSLWFGSMDDAEAEPTGMFYRWSAGGLRAFGEATVVTNGPLVDGDRALAYTADTSGGRVFRHRLDGNGDPGPAEPLIEFGKGDGHPDGLTLDAEGHLWVCHFGGARVTRFTPEGEAVLAVPMPTAQVTKVAFGGPDLATLYVTTAARGHDPEIEPLAGHLFAFEVEGVSGRPAAHCSMG